MRSCPSPTVIEAFGETRTIRQWAEVSGFSVRALRARRERFKGLPGEVMLSLSRNAKMRIDVYALPGAPRSWTWDVLPWEDDMWARNWVAKHPGGGTLDEVGETLGVSCEDVRLIEATALRKFRQEAERLGLPLQSLLAGGLEGDVP